MLFRSEFNTAAWQRMLAINLIGPALVIQAAHPWLKKARRATIVNFASVQGIMPFARSSAYAASKAGVTMFTRHLALEVGPSGVRANVVAPGTTLSERIERVMDDASIARTAAMSPLGRLGLPEDTANATVFLLSDASSWLTGITLDIAGGRVML